MKKLNYLIVLVMCLFSACKDEPERQQPESLQDINVNAIAGGVTITYSIPKNSNIQYVMAEYERNGKVFTERSSIYRNTLTIEGFNTQDKVKATLYTMNRDEVRSNPLTIEFEPKESPLSLAYKSLKLGPGFAGLTAAWENPSKTELGIRLMVEEDQQMVKASKPMGENDRQWKSKDMYFSTLASDIYTFRGFENVETSFAVSMEDKWGNVSDTIYLTTTPYFETEVKKPFLDLRGTTPFEPTPGTTDNSGLPFRMICDNAISGNNSWMQNGYDKNVSLFCTAFTIDIQAVYKLSRMTLWPRMRDDVTLYTDVYTVSNVLTFEIWGADKKTYDASKSQDVGYWLDDFSCPPALKANIPGHTFKDDWVYLGYYEVERLDLKGATPTEIRTKAREGYHFEFPLDASAVRYLRIFPRATDKGSPIPDGSFQITEMSFYGDNTVPQQ